MRSSKVEKKRRRLKKTVRHFILLCLIILVGGLLYQFGQARMASAPEDDVNNKKEPEVKNEPIQKTTITISAAGDVTLGTDERFNYSDSFDAEALRNGLPYFLEGIGDMFLVDDLTTVNLETTLTTATTRAPKKFVFKGDPSYAQILKMGGIDAVTLANNHTFDYLEGGYRDTLNALEDYDIDYFGYEHHYLKTTKGIKIGALGYEGWRDTPEIREQISSDIKSLRERGAKLILVHYHWGIEKQYVPTESQQTLARFTIDSGADLVLGHHPHVIQGIEEYNDKFIVYSLGNFMFGGNRNPQDKDTFVFQQSFYFENGKLKDKKEIKIVPFSISSVSNRNNYQPTVLTGIEYDRVMQKVIDGSNQINGSDWVVYEKQLD